MADTRQFTDHNEIGGVNVYLEDKKLAESPEKNTVASTDYVLLKDIDGVPHKVSKANMMSVVKDAIGELLKSNDLGTSVTNVPALNASAFGSATVANLASVLGGLDAIDVTSQSIDFDNMTNVGKFYVNCDTATNKPSGVDNVYTLIVEKSSTNRYIQTIVGANNVDVYKRFRTAAGTWRAWVRLDNFGCNTPTDLASLLAARQITIQSNESAPLIVKRSTTGVSIIEFRNNNGVIGSIGFESNGTPIIYDSNGTKKTIVVQ